MYWKFDRYDANAEILTATPKTAILEIVLGIIKMTDWNNKPIDHHNFRYEPWHDNIVVVIYTYWTFMKSMPNDKSFFTNGFKAHF